MNIVGKIFTVLVFVMCIALTSFSLMVLAAHKVWRNDVQDSKTGLAKQLADANTERQKLLDEKKKLEDRLVEEKDRYVRRLASLESYSKDLKKEREGNDKLLTEKQAAMGQIVDAIQSIHDQIKALHATVMQMYTDKKTAIAARQQVFAKVLEINDSLLNAVTERLRLMKLGNELGEQLKRMRAAPNVQVRAAPASSGKPN